MEVTCVSKTFYAGWAAVVVLTCVHPSFLSVLATLLFAAGTYALWRQPAIPYRRQALAASWFGPLVALVSYLVSLPWMQAAQAEDVSRVRENLNALIYLGLTESVTALIWITWFIRGYGMFTVLALLMPVWRDKRNQVESPIWPWRWWWIIPPIFAAKGLVMAAMTYHVAESMMHEDWVRTAVLSPDGETIVTGGMLGDIRAPSDALKIYDSSMRERGKPLLGKATNVSDLAYAPDGNLLAATVWKAAGKKARHSIELWDLRRGQLVTHIAEPGACYYGLAFSPRGNLIASSAERGTVGLWQTDGRRSTTLRGAGQCIDAVAFSPDGRLLVGGGCDGAVYVWETASYRLRRTFKGHTKPVFAVAYAPDGKSFASASKDKTVRVWDAANGRLLRTMKVTHGWVRALIYTPDGVTLAGGCNDEKIYCWDAATGKLKQTLTEYSGISALSFTLDGHGLVAISSDRKLRKWPVS